jgi:hypothetical protein
LGANGIRRKTKSKLNRWGRSHSYNAQLSPPIKSNIKATTNATGTHLDIDDARGYSWRAKPQGLGEAGGIGTSPKVSKKASDKKGKGRASESSGSDSEADDENDEGGARGYTQLRFDDDPEVEQISAASDYLFTGTGKGNPLEDDDAHATPHSQLNTTKNLLSEGQKIAYVGLVSLVAKGIIRQLQRVPGKELQAAITSTEEWRLRVMARLFQHMDIEIGEQNMIESLAQHGVLPTDLSPSLITTQTVDNPDFDPEAERERAEEKEREKQQVEERQAEEAKERAQEEEARAIQESIDRERRMRESEEAEEDTDTEVEDGDLGDLGDLGDVPKRRSGPVKPKHMLPEDEGGDIGALSDNESAANDSISPPPPAYAEEDEGDIAAALDSPKVTPKILPEEKEEKSLRTDPNTAARIVLDSKVTPMGLTSTTQTIDTLPSALEGVTTELSSADKTITLDLRWTVLCDLFLVLTADSVYDARSRVLLERVAEELGLHWMDVTKFEKRVTDALEIQEGVSGSLKGKKEVKRRAEAARRRRMVMMGLATVGGGLVIGLSAGLMAPLIGAGLGAALGTIGVGGTTSFLGGVGGAAIITTTGTVGGAALGGQGMNKRTRTVRTFEFKPIHNNKRVNCIVTVPGFMNGPMDDPRLPFSVIDSIMGDVFSVLWEPDMMQEMGNAINLLWNETLVQGVQQVLAATIAGGLVGALALPLWLTKLGYFIDNPWSNALDRAHSCGLILADVLIKRKMGIRPITLVGFSLGARVIFYALVELAKQKKYGIVQNVYLMGAPVTANDKTWKEARGVVAGRFVNAFSRTDWILGYLFRATSGGLRSIAGLHPVEKVPEVENVDVTRTVPGHLQYRAYVPLVLDELGFKTTADYFDEPEDLNAVPEREIRYDEQYKEKRPTNFAELWKKRKEQGGSGSQPSTPNKASSMDYDEDADLPPRQEAEVAPAVPPTEQEMDEMQKVLAELRENGIEVKELESSLPPLPIISTPIRTSSKAGLMPPVNAPMATYVRASSSGPPSSASSRRPSNASRHSDEGSFDSPNGRPHSRSNAYARKFGSTIFDADELPPAAPQAGSDQGSISLSFADSYEDDDEGGLGEKEATVNAGPQKESLQSGKHYGLSDETARELARQFQSSGMSTEGASAAAKMAQNFSEMDQGPSIAVTPGARTPIEAPDPWTVPLSAPPEPPQSYSMGRTRSKQDESQDVRTPTVAAWSNDNPWG